MASIEADADQRRLLQRLRNESQAFPTKQDLEDQIAFTEERKLWLRLFLIFPEGKQNS
jgi:hypothetical protein